MSESSKGFGHIKEVLIGGAAGLGVLALIIGGFSISGGGLPTSDNASQTPTSSSSASSSASASPTDLRVCSVNELAIDPRLVNLAAVVIRADTGEVLFDRNAKVAATPASVAKTITAAAALMTLGPNYRVDTRVYSDPNEPGTIILVGGGDPTLSRTAAGVQSVYRDAPKLSTLAVGVNSKMAGVPITKIILDNTLFAGPAWESSWERSELTQGYMSEVTALQVDGDRQNPGKETSTRSSKSVLNAGNYFKRALGASASAAVVSEGKLPNTAVEIAKVSSQPISKWITHMLQVSDNTQAEYLARLVSLDMGFDGSFSSINAAFKKALLPTQLDATGLVLKDGSGLSNGNAVSPTYVASLMKLVLDGYGDFSVIKQGLPVSGESGSLASRFTGDNADAAGHVAAKTGWIKKGYTLGGIISAKDGTDLVFAVYALGDVADSAKLAIDNLVTGFYRCGDTLSNN